MNGYDAYVMYVSLKNHFTKRNYDYFKYNGKARTKLETFEKRNDKIFFLKLAKHNDLLGFLVSNFIINKDFWVRELAYNKEAEDNYKQWLKKKNSLQYTFENDLNKLDERFKSNFIVKSNEHPNILKLLLQKEISLETFCILVDITSAQSYLNKRLKDDVTWEDVSMKCIKYLPFIKYDKDKYTQICIDKFSNT